MGAEINIPAGSDTKHAPWNEEDIPQSEIDAEIDLDTAMSVLGRHFYEFLTDAIVTGSTEGHQDSIATALYEEDWCELGRLIGEEAKAEMERYVRNERGW